MARTIRNEYDKALTYENLMKAHLQSRKGKGYRKEIILFNLKQEEYIMWLYEQLKTGKYRHGGYTEFYVTQPKLRRIEKSKYIDRIVHRWYVNSFIEKYIKHNLKCKYYYRYMDDAVILINTKDEAKEMLERIKKFLEVKLQLELNQKTQIFKSKQGVNFCGYKINEYRLKIRDRGKRKLKKKVKSLKEKVESGEISSKEAKLYLAGHLGYIKIANVRNLKDKLFA